MIEHIVIHALGDNNQDKLLSKFVSLATNIK
jgi:hypothetical protein